MPAGSLLALLDDVASVLDDVATLTQVAAKKTAGVLGDDLALNAEQVSGVRADRELPVVWAVAKGSVVNKLILVPSALGISTVAPFAVSPLLMLGGAFLCFEGAEKLAHKADPSPPQSEPGPEADAVDRVEVERDKIKGAIRTDFILSAEIVTIALGTVATEPLGTRVAVLSSIAALMTVGVYGLVAGIVKLDDLGLHLAREGSSGFRRRLGMTILRTAPYLMKTLSVAGTVAMFLVGGGILTHGVPFLHAAVGQVTAGAGRMLPSVLAWFVPLLGDLLVGLGVGFVIVALVSVAARARASFSTRTS